MVVPASITSATSASLERSSFINLVSRAFARLRMVDLFPDKAFRMSTRLLILLEAGSFPSVPVTLEFLFRIKDGMIGSLISKNKGHLFYLGLKHFIFIYS